EQPPGEERSPAAAPDETGQEAGDESGRVVIDLVEPADGLPPVITTAEDLAAAVARLAAGAGPVAVDAERASGYRYGQRAYLVQLRRLGAGTVLIDPIACPDLSGLGAALADVEAVLHAASQDLPCLAEIGYQPRELFDTELAGRLLGYPRVALGTMLEEVLGFRLAKEPSAADWPRGRARSSPRSRPRPRRRPGSTRGAARRGSTRCGPGGRSRSCGSCGRRG